MPPDSSTASGPPSALQFRQTLRWDPSQNPLGSPGPTLTNSAAVGAQLPASTPPAAEVAPQVGAQNRRGFGATALGLGPVSAPPGDARRHLELGDPESNDDLPWNNGQAARTRKRAAVAIGGLAAAMGLLILLNQGGAPAPDSDQLKKPITTTIAAPIQNLPAAEPAKPPTPEPAAEQKPPEPTMPEATARSGAGVESESLVAAVDQADPGPSRSTKKAAKGEKGKRPSAAARGEGQAAVKPKPAKPAAASHAAPPKKPSAEAPTAKAQAAKAPADDPLGRRK